MENPCTDFLCFLSVLLPFKDVHSCILSSSECDILSFPAPTWYLCEVVYFYTILYLFFSFSFPRLITFVFCLQCKPLQMMCVCVFVHIILLRHPHLASLGWFAAERVRACLCVRVVLILCWFFTQGWGCFMDNLYLWLIDKINTVSIAKRSYLSHDCCCFRDLNTLLLFLLSFSVVMGSSFHP